MIANQPITIKTEEILLVALPAALEGVVNEAARLVFSSARFVTIGDGDSIDPAKVPEGVRLAVLTDADTEAVAVATQATTAAGLPRWAVVVLGQDPSDCADAVAPEEWTPPLLARVFRSALLQHELLCENVRLRGDLKTVARRIGHDLRVPVGCIFTSSDILRGLDAASLDSMADVIKQSSVEIAQIIDRVAFVLKASADPSSPTRVDMGAIVAASLQQMDTELQESGAQVTRPDSWPDVCGVGPWLEVIWSNLLRNAVRHGGPAARIRIEWRQEEDGCRFSVTDRGTGVAAARQAGLFRAFDQLHVLHTPGLGLSITQRLVTLQQGRCGFESPSEGGASFFFTLPLAAAGV